MTGSASEGFLWGPGAAVQGHFTNPKLARPWPELPVPSGLLQPPEASAQVTNGYQGRRLA